MLTQRVGGLRLIELHHTTQKLKLCGLIFTAQRSYLTGITADTFCVTAQRSYLTGITAYTVSPYMTVAHSVNFILTWNDSEGYVYLLTSKLHETLFYAPFQDIPRWNVCNERHTIAYLIQ